MDDLAEAMAATYDGSPESLDRLLRCLNTADVDDLATDLSVVADDLLPVDEVARRRLDVEQNRAIPGAGPANRQFRGNYVIVHTSIVLATGYHPDHSPGGIVWTAVTAAAMFALAAGKARAGAALNNPVLRTEGRVILVDSILAAAVLAGLVLNAALGWWWGDPVAGYVLVFYAVREVRAILTEQH